MEPELIIERLVAQLQALKYGIVSIREAEIIFNDGPGIKWRHEPSQIDEGVFNLSTQDNETLIKLTYIISYWSYLLSVLFFLLLSTFEDPYILYLVAFILISGLIEHFTLKSKAKSLVRVCKP